MRTLRLQSLALSAIGLALSPGWVSAQRLSDLTPYLIANRAEEIALARTAAPRAISDSATVLVLTRTGFVEAYAGATASPAS